MNDGDVFVGVKDVYWVELALSRKCVVRVGDSERVKSGNKQQVKIPFGECFVDNVRESRLRFESRKKK